MKAADFVTIVCSTDFSTVKTTLFWYWLNTIVIKRYTVIHLPITVVSELLTLVINENTNGFRQITVVFWPNTTVFRPSTTVFGQNTVVNELIPVPINSITPVFCRYAIVFVPFIITLRQNINVNGYKAYLVYVDGFVLPENTLCPPSNYAFPSDYRHSRGNASLYTYLSDFWKRYSRQWFVQISLTLSINLVKFNYYATKKGHN
jgi:membrane-associated phospholipid phosphatase